MVLTLDEAAKILGMVAQTIIIVGLPVAGIVAFNRLRDAVAGVAKDVLTVKDDVAGVKSDIKDLKGNVHAQDVALGKIQVTIDGADRRAADHGNQDTARFAAIEERLVAEKTSRHELGNQMQIHLLALNQQFGEIKGLIQAGFKPRGS